VLALQRIAKTTLHSNVVVVRDWNSDINLSIVCVHLVRG